MEYPVSYIFKQFSYLNKKNNAQQEAWDVGIKLVLNEVVCEEIAVAE